VAMAPYEELSIPKNIVGCLAESAIKTFRIEQTLFALDSLPHRPSSEARRLQHNLYHRLGTALSYFDLYRSAVFSNRAVLLALETGSDLEVASALAAYSVFISYRRGRQNIARAQQIHAKATRWLPKQLDPEALLWLEVAQGIIEFVAGNYRESADLLSVVLDKYPRMGLLQTPEVMLAYVYASAAIAWGHDLRKGMEVLRGPFEKAVAENDQLSLRLILPTLSCQATLAGDYQLANTLHGKRPSAQQKYICPLEDTFDFSRAVYLLSQGAFLYAEGILTRLLQNPFQNSFLVYPEQKYRSQFLLGIVYLAQAKHTNSASKRKELLSKAYHSASPGSASDDPVLEGIAWRIMGLVEAARGKPKEAKSWLDKAISSLAIRGEPTELSAALLARGAICGSSADIERGRAIFEGTSFADPAEREGFGWNWR
jgi:tetratricopeptide (TPR) repeat protein